MITVKIVRDTARRITGVFMSGHAEYTEEGPDIVCAGASVLIYTLANAIETICGINAEDISRIVPGEDVSAEVIIPYERLKDEKSKERATVIADTIHTGFVTLAADANEDGIRYIELIEDI